MKFGRTFLIFLLHFVSNVASLSIYSENKIGHLDDTIHRRQAKYNQFPLFNFFQNAKTSNYYLAKPYGLRNLRQLQPLPLKSRQLDHDTSLEQKHLIKSQETSNEEAKGYSTFTSDENSQPLLPETNIVETSPHFHIFLNHIKDIENATQDEMLNPNPAVSTVIEGTKNFEQGGFSNTQVIPEAAQPNSQSIFSENHAPQTYTGNTVLDTRTHTESQASNSQDSSQQSGASASSADSTSQSGSSASSADSTSQSGASASSTGSASQSGSSDSQNAASQNTATDTQGSSSEPGSSNSQSNPSQSSSGSQTGNSASSQTSQTQEDSNSVQAEEKCSANDVVKELKIAPESLDFKTAAFSFEIIGHGSEKLESIVSIFSEEPSTGSDSSNANQQNNAGSSNSNQQNNAGSSSDQNVQNTGGSGSTDQNVQNTGGSGSTDQNVQNTGGSGSTDQNVQNTGGSGSTDQNVQNTGGSGSTDQNMQNNAGSSRTDQNMQNSAGTGSTDQNMQNAARSSSPGQNRQNTDESSNAAQNQQSAAGSTNPEQNPQNTDESSNADQNQQSAAGSTNPEQNPQNTDESSNADQNQQSAAGSTSANEQNTNESKLPTYPISCKWSYMVGRGCQVGLLIITIEAELYETIYCNDNYLSVTYNSVEDKYCGTLNKKQLIYFFNGGEVFRVHHYRSTPDDKLPYGKQAVARIRVDGFCNIFDPAFKKEHEKKTSNRNELILTHVTHEINQEAHLNTSELIAYTEEANTETTPTDEQNTTDAYQLSEIFVNSTQEVINSTDDKSIVELLASDDVTKSEEIQNNGYMQKRTNRS